MIILVFLLIIYKLLYHFAIFEVGNKILPVTIKRENETELMLNKSEVSNTNISDDKNKVQSMKRKNKSKTSTEDNEIKVKSNKVKKTELISANVTESNTDQNKSQSIKSSKNVKLSNWD